MENSLQHEHATFLDAGQVANVTCAEGYAEPGNQTATFLVTCDNTTPPPSLANVLTCEGMFFLSFCHFKVNIIIELTTVLLGVACPELTIPHSNITELSGYTLDTHAVQCNDGYAADTDSLFLITCAGVQPGHSDWSNAQASFE